ncbi:hypothetical protein [Roseovarius nanhaiticus]|uniref:hypothetical protein n=1 Tax=Roseovarius nanhaiticus TaxID=573024 RepID=UPI00248F7067|nr:hypothetical protein [Roseovarius nanhaiticus]
MTLSDLQPSHPDDLIARSCKGSPSGHEGAPISIQMSIHAFKLASHSNAAFSIEDLIESGTWQKYERRAAVLARGHPRGDPFKVFLSRLEFDGWNTPNARQADRSALVRLAARDVLELTPIYWRETLNRIETGEEQQECLGSLRPHLSPSVKQQMKDAVRPLSGVERAHLASAVHFLIEVPPDPFHDQARTRKREDKTAPDTRRRRDRSAQSALTALGRHERRRRNVLPNYDWRTHLWTSAIAKDRHLDITRRAILATMMLTGVRPAEFAEDYGVDIRLVEAEGADRLIFQIKGAKCITQLYETLPGKGQSVREIEIACKVPEASWLREAVLEKGNLHLTVSSPAKSANGIQLPASERHRRVSVSLGKLVTRLGKLAFPSLRHNLTPYVFRHAVAADMKNSDRFDSEMIASALGHQTTRTQRSYGLKSSGRNLSLDRIEAITRVSAVSPVRDRGRLEERFGSDAG